MQGIHRRAGLPSQPTAAASDRETMRTGRQPIILAALTPIGLTWPAPPALHYGQAARREVLPVLIGEPPPAAAVSPLLRQQPTAAGYSPPERAAPAAARAPIILSASSIREPREMSMLHHRKIKRRAVWALLLACLAAGPVHAGTCSNPVGNESDIKYNNDFHT